MKLIDLSVTLDNDRDWAPWWARNKVVRQSHAFGSFAVWLVFGLWPSYLKNKLGWANDVIKLSTHGTTHLDAPWHYGPMSEGKPAKTIDEIPLDWCFSDGVVLDMSQKRDGGVIRKKDIVEALEKINYTLKPMDIVLIRTGNDKMLGSRDYFTKGPGVTANATRYILEQGVKVTGIDSWGWDVPLPHMARRARRTRDKEHFWEAHYVGVEKEYCHMERLTNLDKLPPYGFKVCCFPLKVKGGSAGPARVVAMVDENQDA